MAPPKWTVFDGIDDAGEEDSNTGETNDTAGNAGGAKDTYGVPEADTSEDLGATADSAGGNEDGAGDQKAEDEDPKEGDGDKPDKKELLVCAGAMCTCTMAVSLTPIALKVQMQDKYSINDPDGTTKYLATDKEVDKAALDFVQCKFPDPSKPRPCTALLVWKDFYEHMVLPGGTHPLTYKSTAVCTVGNGEVAFQTTGQQSTVTPEQVEASNSAGWPQENPVIDESAADVEMEKDEAEGDQKGVGVLAIKAKTAGPYPVGTTITFEAVKLSPTKKTYTAAELQGINWNVYDASLKPCGHAIDGGRETDIKFNKAGRFTVEGYGVTAGGSSKDAKPQKRSAIATLTIEENKLSGVQRKGTSGGAEYRFEEPAVYELTTLFPVGSVPLPRRQTLENVVWTVLKKGGEGEPVLVSAGSNATVTCTAPCDYVVIATLGETAQQSGRMKAIKNAVTTVSANLKSCRPGEEVVLKAKFKIEPALPAELALLKWTCKDGKGVEHKEGFVPGSQIQQLRLKPVGHYKVYAFVHSPSKNVVAEFEVTQPRVKSVQWFYSDKVTGKRVTGWEEDNWVKMVFESAQGLGAEATVGVVRDNAFHPVMKSVSFTVGKDNEDSFHFVLTKEDFKGKLKEGDYLSVQINCTTLGQSIAGGATHMLQFTGKEGLGGIAFYRGKERVNHAHYGEALRCRVYGRNLSAGKARVVIGRFESFGGKGPQVPVIVEDRTVIIGESGYGEFDFFLDVNKAKGTNSTLHKFGAWIQEAEVGGKHVFVRPEEARGVQMLFVPVPVGVGSGAPSEAGIERGENSPADGKCVCEAKVRAFMRMLRVGEGTGELIKSFDYKSNKIIYNPKNPQIGYETAYGNNKITDFSTHPQKVYRGESSAAGAYQFLRHVWWDLSGFEVENQKKTGKYREEDDLLKKHYIFDFSPESQDKICLVLMEKQRPKLLDKIISGNIEESIRTEGCFIWASLPEFADQSHYFLHKKRQPATPIKTCLEHYNLFLKQELAGISNLHLKKGFLKEFSCTPCASCCPAEGTPISTLSSCPLCKSSHFDLTNTVEWQSQFNPIWGDLKAQNSACKKACDAILNKRGLANTLPSLLYQIATENEDHSKLIINSTVSREAVLYISEQLSLGNPVQVGVDHALNYRGGINEGTTDHFIVIVGKSCIEGKVNYTFFDVGTKFKDKGASKKNRLFLDETDNSLKGRTEYNGNFYTVTQVRKNKNL